MRNLDKLLACVSLGLVMVGCEVGDTTADDESSDDSLTAAAASPSYVEFSNFSDAISTSPLLGVVSTFTATDTVLGIGSQSVSAIPQDAELIYSNLPGTLPFSEICYYARAFVEPGITATTVRAVFVGQGNSKTVNLVVDKNYQKVCVSSSTSAQENFNVKNISTLPPSSIGPSSLVYVFQAEVIY